MLNKTTLRKVPTILVLLLLLIIAPTDVMGGKGHGHDDDEYSMELSALMGADGAELVVILSTTDAENFPIPEELEKIKVKIHQKKTFPRSWSWSTS